MQMAQVSISHFVDSIIKLVGGFICCGFLVDGALVAAVAGPSLFITGSSSDCDGDDGGAVSLSYPPPIPEPRDDSKEAHKENSLPVEAVHCDALRGESFFFFFFSFESIVEVVVVVVDCSTTTIINDDAKMALVMSNDLDTMCDLAISSVATAPPQFFPTLVPDLYEWTIADDMLLFSGL